MPRSGAAGSRSPSKFELLIHLFEKPPLSPISIMAASAYIPASRKRGLLFLHILSGICRWRDVGHSDWGEKEP